MISENLKKLIEKYNLNTLELARRTGIGQPVIYRIMTGETDNPKIATVRTLADYFGISVNQLLGENAPSSFNKPENVFTPSQILCHLAKFLPLHHFYDHQDIRQIQ